MYPASQSIVLRSRDTSHACVRRSRRKVVVVPDNLPVFPPQFVSTNIGVWNDVPFQVSPRFVLPEIF